MTWLYEAQFAAPLILIGSSAQYTASRIAGAKFIGFDQVGHVWVGHDDEVCAAIVELLLPPGRP